MRAAEAERDAANAQAARLQTDLTRATDTLQNMERLLKALKQHKAAAAEAAAREAEGAAQVSQLQAQMKSMQETAAGHTAVLRTHKAAVTRLQGEVEACERTKHAHSRLIVRTLVERAIGKAVAAEAGESAKTVGQLRKGLRAALAKLDKAREEASETKAELASRGKQRSEMEKAVAELQAQLSDKARSVEDLEAAVAQLTGRVQAEREALAAVEQGRAQAEARHEKECRDLRAQCQARADECALASALALCVVALYSREVHWHRLGRAAVITRSGCAGCKQRGRRPTSSRAI